MQRFSENNWCSITSVINLVLLGAVSLSITALYQLLKKEFCHVMCKSN